MRIKLCLAALLLSAVVANAQNDYKYWSSGKLSWSDYTKSSAIGDDGAASANSFGWETKDSHEEFGNLTVHRVSSNVYLNKSLSWVNPTLATDRQLTYNQLFFDLNELYCRMMLRDIYDPTVNFEVGFLQDYYIGLVAVKMSEINTMSDHGNDTETIAYFDAVIKSQLEALPRTEFKPSSLKKDKHGFGAWVGIGTEFFLGEPGEFLSPVYSMDFGLRYYYTRFFVDGNFAIGALKSREAIDSGSEKIIKGTALSDLRANVYAGYNLYDGSWVRIAPMVGVGFHGISALESDDDEVTPTLIKGMRLIGGLDFDIKTSREAYLLPDDRSLTENCFNLRVFLAKTGFNAGLDGLSLNFGISYAIQFFGLKSW